MDAQGFGCHLDQSTNANRLRARNDEHVARHQFVCRRKLECPEQVADVQGVAHVCSAANKEEFFTRNGAKQLQRAGAAGAIYPGGPYNYRR